MNGGSGVTVPWSGRGLAYTDANHAFAVSSCTAALELTGFGDAECPESERFFDYMISFPFHHWMAKDEFEAMIELTQTALSRLRGEN